LSIQNRNPISAEIQPRVCDTFFAYQVKQAIGMLVKRPKRTT
jgi:hypothetical protein